MVSLKFHCLQVNIHVNMVWSRCYILIVTSHLNGFYTDSMWLWLWYKNNHNNERALIKRVFVCEWDPNGIFTLHGTGVGTDTGTGNRINGSQKCSHWSRTGTGTWPIVAYCASLVPSTCLGPTPVQCECTLRNITYTGKMFIQWIQWIWNLVMSLKEGHLHLVTVTL